MKTAAHKERRNFREALGVLLACLEAAKGMRLEDRIKHKAGKHTKAARAEHCCACSIPAAAALAQRWPGSETKNLLECVR